jgi:hypothetical protein
MNKNMPYLKSKEYLDTVRGYFWDEDEELEI